MKKNVIVIILTWLATFFVFAQNKNVYTESVVVNINNDFLITGETLYYTIHCLNNEDRYSTLSKLAYVELIGDSERPFFQTKTELIEGRGAGDFFLPSTLPSGNYTLIAYTKWMRNFPIENFFRTQIKIVNPYLKPLMVETKINGITSNKPISENRVKADQVNLSSDQKKYSHRQKVRVIIKNGDPSSNCNVSLNVHWYDKKTTETKLAAKSKSSNKANLSLTTGSTEKGQFTFLPDLRGETISGVLKDGTSHQPVSNTDVYLSAPGTPYFFQMSQTDSSGRFYFSTKNIQTKNGIRFQIDQLSKPGSIEIKLDDEFVNEYGSFKPLPFSIDTTIRKQIEKRNIYSQIENAYFFKKQDSILNFNQPYFFDKPDKVYKLDEFTRFPTMEDILREYVYEVVVFKRDGNFVLRLTDSNNKSSRFVNAPLIIIDGIRIYDTQALMNYNPLLIKSISLVTRRYIHAGILFDGVLSVNTYEGNAKDFPTSTIVKQYTSWQQSKNYYSPVYNMENGLNRIPDYRFQLLWNPGISIEPSGECIIEFYTSDVDGDFMIEAKGFNSKGEEINLSSIIEVRK